jgi:bacteriorhodopsin
MCRPGPARARRRYTALRAGRLTCSGRRATLGSIAWKIFDRIAPHALCLVQALAPTACTTIEEVGSTGVGALTLGFLALAVSTVVMVAKAASADAERRKYYFCNTFICGVATFSYFAMLSGQGWTAIAGCRQFFYARYVDWMITTALLILDLGLVAGQDFVTIAAVIGADSKLFH